MCSPVLFFFWINGGKLNKGFIETSTSPHVTHKRHICILPKGKQCDLFFRIAYRKCLPAVVLKVKFAHFFIFKKLTVTDVWICCLLSKNQYTAQGLRVKDMKIHLEDEFEEQAQLFARWCQNTGHFHSQHDSYDLYSTVNSLSSNSLHEVLLSLYNIMSVGGL